MIALWWWAIWHGIAWRTSEHGVEAWTLVGIDADGVVSWRHWVAKP